MERADERGMAAKDGKAFSVEYVPEPNCGVAAGGSDA